MKQELIETGKIVNTHGVRGEVKILPWADSPEFLLDFDHFYIDGTEIEVLSARIHKGCVIAAFDGVADIKSAAALRNKVISIKKEDANLQEDAYFVADLIGITAIDYETGEKLGHVAEILPLPQGNVYVIRGEREILVPAVPEFIKETNLQDGYVRLYLIEGL
ncbi:MAG: ribosome maturation factor RimM [Oscillospiraceae bacterium]|nr:ribosome maturation factor RimM [Oscillospiraceae bacterium]